MDLLDTIYAKSKMFEGTTYQTIVDTAMSYWNSGMTELAITELKKLPTTEELLDKLIEKLKGKSVYNNLKRLQRGVVTNRYSKLKIMSSLLTHIAIECEHGNKEYNHLLYAINEKIGMLLFGGEE